jgi:salicylate hydroxylase
MSSAWRSDVRIAIVGAGIAGLTTAAALSRVGLSCQVYEQAPAFGEVGAGIQIAPNAARILHRLGLAARLGEIGVRAQALELRRWNDGATLARTPFGAECETLFGAPYYLVHRAELHRGLVELLPDDTVHLGSVCTGVIERADGVELRFADAATETVDVVIGADGIHSTVRKILATDAPRFSGQTIYRGLVPAERLPFLLDDPKVIVWLGPEQHCVCYPISAGKLISFGATTPAGRWRVESWSAPGRIEDLRAAYSGWNDQVQQLITAADTVSRWALHDRDALDRWSSQRLTLVGDAAHPMLPFMAQGANQAIEDATVLAACLRAATSRTIPDALARYEEVRKRRTAEIQLASRSKTDTFHLYDGDQQRRRDATLVDIQELASQEWLYGYEPEVA